jgi:hypothetical protein
MSGRPFIGVTCARTVATLSEAMQGIEPGSRVVVRAFWSNDADSIAGMGTYRDRAIENVLMVTDLSRPIVIEAEGFNPGGAFVKPIISGAVRVPGPWEPTPGTAATWHTPLDVMPGSFEHTDCVDRIWVSRAPGKTQLANFPLTRPFPEQGANGQGDCGANALGGRPVTPQDVDAFPGSYEWLDGKLYVRLPGGENPNLFTVEVPYRHSMSPGRGSSGLVIRGFRVYHAVNGIDLWHCGSSPADRCEATFNDTSYNTHFGLQPGRYGLLARNSGVYNTIQLIKITSDFSEIAYNTVGPQLAQGFKLNDVRDCVVHHNEVYGNNLTQVSAPTQAGWIIVGTRDATAGIYLKNGTQRCRVFNNYVHHNRTGVYLRNDGSTLTEANVIENNSLVYNEIALRWDDDQMWAYNTARNNSLGWGARIRWVDTIGTLFEFEAATGVALSS